MKENFLTKIIFKKFTFRGGGGRGQFGKSSQFVFVFFAPFPKASPMLWKLVYSLTDNKREFSIAGPSFLPGTNYLLLNFTITSTLSDLSSSRILFSLTFPTPSPTPGVYNSEARPYAS